MKKFFLLMALVLTAGVVQAQNFFDRTRLQTAVKLYSSNEYLIGDQNHGNSNGNWIPSTKTLWWDWAPDIHQIGGGHQQTYFNGDSYKVKLISKDQLTNDLNGVPLLSKYENFVIRTSNLKKYHNNGAGYGLNTDEEHQDEPAESYSISFRNASGNEVTRLNFWKDDVHIAPLRSLCKLVNGSYVPLSESEINSIASVNLESDSPDGQVTLEEAYFISAYQPYNGEFDYRDKDNKDIGNAYIDPSFLIQSNNFHITVNSDHTATLTMSEGGGDLFFSLPYSGIDMSNITYVTIDRSGVDALDRFVFENKKVDLHNKLTQEQADQNYSIARQVFLSRYNANFNNETANGYAITQPSKRAYEVINNIYWKKKGGATGTMFIQDICFTKNYVQSRTTRQQLDKSLYNNSDCAMVYNTEQNGSAQIFGNWDASNNGYYADLSSYKKMKISGTPNVSITVRYRTIKNGTGWTEIYAKTDNRGEVNIDLIDLRNKDDNAEGFYLNDIFFSYNQTGPYKVNNIELFDGVGKKVPIFGTEDKDNPNIDDNMYHLWNNDDNYQWQYGTIVRWRDPNFVNNIGTTQNGTDAGVIWGTSTVYPEAYADLTGYKAIRVEGDNGGHVRLVFNMKNNHGGTAVYKELVKDIVDGVAEFDISNYEYFHLNAIKATGGNTTTKVTAIKLIENEEADYVLYGNGLLGDNANSAINDVTAKVIDTRARCNNSQERPIYDEMWLLMPQTGNQNALYIERTEQFANSTNMIVPSDLDYNTGTSEYFTSTNIELQDNYSFYAPKEIRAKNAKFTRTFNNANVVNSIILPFAVNPGVDEKYGFYETNVTLKSTMNEGKVGILGKQDVNEGDWLLQFTKTTENTKPNTPYLYAVKEVSPESGTVFTGVPENNIVTIPETPDVEVAAHKNMTNNLPNADNPTYDFYLRGVYEGTYMEHILFYSAGGTLYRTPFMTVTPFRTIIKSPIPVVANDAEWNASQSTYFESNTVKVVLAFDPNDESMDINSLVADGIFAEDAPIYNVAGQRVNTFDKGIYIVGGKKILVK